MGSIGMEALSSLVRAAQGGDLEASFVAEAYTEIPGEYVRVEDTVKGFKELLEGRYDDLPDQAFYFVGGVAEAIAKAGKE